MADLPVSVSLDDLKNGSIPHQTLIDAFGPESLGIIIVKDIGTDFGILRSRLLSYSSYLGNLPAFRLEKFESPESKYLVGWSRGKEKLKTGQIDTMKGSYYANCAFYVDPKLQCATPTGEFSAVNFPEYLSPNIWPSHGIVPGFQSTFEELCRLIINIGVVVAKACDRYGEKEIAGYQSGYLEHVVKTSTTTKARLLHYFPAPLPSDYPEPSLDDDWCATHIDHGCLTGLTSAMFVNEYSSPPVIPICYNRGGGGAQLLDPLTELDASPDPEAGLYILSRSGKTVQVKIPRDCVAFQTGQALEKITRGRFKAVPHYVKGIRAGFGDGRVARNTLAVFTQPNLGEMVDREQGITFGEFAKGVVEKNTTK